MLKSLISRTIRGATWLVVVGMVLVLAAPAYSMPMCAFPHPESDPEVQPCNVPPPPGFLPTNTCYRTTESNGVTCESIGFTCSGPNYCYGAFAAVPELEDYAAAAFLVLALTIGWQVRQRRMSV